jgi:DNA-binding transcriptional ArsR family regulator
LLADPSRAAMLAALLDGRARPAGELARAAGITAQTASAHLAKLLAGGLLARATEGRHRYYRLAGAHVAQAIEQLAALRPQAALRRNAPSPQQRQLRFCRSCYDHLAGQLGVAVARALQERGCIAPAADRQYAVTAAGAAWFARAGVDVARVKPARRGLARPCLDCTERAPHLAGPLGVQLLRAWCARGWLRRSAASRAVAVTPQGWLALRQLLGLTEEQVRAAGLPD